MPARLIFDDVRPVLLPGNCESGTRVAPLPSYISYTIDVPAGNELLAVKFPHDCKFAGPIVTDCTCPDVALAESCATPLAIVTFEEVATFTLFEKESVHVEGRICVYVLT